MLCNFVRCKCLLLKWFGIYYTKVSHAMWIISCSINANRIV